MPLTDEHETVSGEDKSRGKEQFAIRELSERTGVNTVTLRAWERRYGLLHPQRTAKGHRLYTAGDVMRVKHIMDWITRGVPVGKVRPLLEEAAIERSLDGERIAEAPGVWAVEQEGAGIEGEWPVIREQLLLAANQYQAARVDQLLNRHFKQYPLSLCVDYWLRPVLEQLSTQQVAQTAFLHAVLKSRIAIRLQAMNRDARGAPVLLLCERGTASWRVWLQALWLADHGYHIQVIDEAPSVVHWNELLEGLRAQALIAYRESQCSPAQKKQLVQLAKASAPVWLAGAGYWLDQKQGKLNASQHVRFCSRISEAANALLTGSA